MRFITACKEISAVTPGYGWGGGHDRPISKVRGTQRLDCSGSISRALYLAGFFPFPWALTSSDFDQWGAPGKGKDFTIWYKPRRFVKGHVFAEFHGKNAGWRFDTSPWGVGPLGPRMRHGSRGMTNFLPRHMPGH